MTHRVLSRTLGAVIGLLLISPAMALAACADIATAITASGTTLQAALTAAKNSPNGGFSLNMWASIVDRDGIVCQVVFTGADRGAQWPASRVISAQKANTANAFSLPGLALSTANLYTAVQPGGSLFGLQESNPVNTEVAYNGSPAQYGTGTNDPMVNGKIGGVNVFGGGLALYRSDGTLLGGLGVSGDSSCADHNIAWKVRHALNLDNVPAGVANGNDNIVYDISSPGKSQAIPPKSASGWGHPECSADATAIGNALPTNYAIGPNP